MSLTSLRQVPALYARLIELVRVAEALGHASAEIATLVDDHALVVASLGRKVLQPRPITGSERRLIETHAGHARMDRTVSFAARDADGSLLAMLTLADDVRAVAVDGMYGIARLIAEVFADDSVRSIHADRATAVLDAMRDPVVVLDSDLVIRFATEGVGTLIGRSPRELTGKSAGEIIHPDDFLTAADAVGRLVGGREIYRASIRLRHGSGEYVRIEMTGNDRTFDPRVKGIVLSLRSDDRDLELADELERERSLLAAVLDQLHEGVVATDQIGVPTVVNQAAKALHRLPRNASASSLSLSDIALWDAEHVPVPASRHPVNRVRAGEHIAGHPYSIYDNDGSVRHVVISGRPVVNASGEQVASALAYHDATQTRLTEGNLRNSALHDPLTGLPNRQQLNERLERLGASDDDTLIGLCFIDLDGFKLVNDTFGHAVGDEVLRSAARRLGTELRPADLLARLGGDEFVAVLTGAPDFGAASAIAERLRAAIDQPFVIDGTAVSLSASLGVATVIARELVPERLLRDADLALYAAKANGKDRVEFFGHDLADAAEGHTRQVQLLRDTLTANTLVMHFQPTVDVETGAVVGIEAMARCALFDGSLVGPAAFLPAAISSGLIWELDRQAFDLSCRAAAILRQRCPQLRVPITCNFGGLSVSQPSFVTEVMSTIKRHGIESDQVCVEITERAAFELNERVKDTLRSLAELGVGLVLDDFGTGRSSLTHLRELPLVAVKVDPILTAGTSQDSTDSAIAHAFVRLADSLGLMVVAEGIESAEQLRRTREVGFRVAQGYLFSPAVPLEELVHLLERPVHQWRIDSDQVCHSATVKAPSP